MHHIIRQTVLLPASVDILFDMYLDPAAHQAITGSPVEIGPDPGSAFKAFDGALSGTILESIKPRLIVQAWRSTSFYTTDPDSILILSFSPKGDGGQIDLVHLNVPDQDYEGVTEGWKKYYWEPWRAYLASNE